jgi:hypothetical protein
MDNLLCTNITTATIHAIQNLVAIGEVNTLGSLYTIAGNIGINTVIPEYKLDVDGTVRIKDSLYAVSTFNEIGELYTKNDKVGICTNDPLYTLDVDGSARIKDMITTGSVCANDFGGQDNSKFRSGTGGYWASFGPSYGNRSDRNGFNKDAFYSGRGGYTSTSDRRIKKNIQDINDSAALDLINKLKPKTYNYIDESKTSELVYGFIAQEVSEVIPYSVIKKDDSVPIIYDKGNIIYDEQLNKSTITLQTKTLHDIQEIKVGDKLVLQRIPTDLNNIIEMVYNIIDIIDERTCVIDGMIDSSIITNGEIFVYGIIVTDFHYLNKDAIWAISTAAIQELDKQLRYSKTEFDTTKNQLEILMADYQTTKLELQTLKSMIETMNANTI